MLNSKHISVVMQGPVVHEGSDAFPFPLTLTALREIRALLPDAQIILSTWEGEKTSYIDSLDELVVSPDPGAQGVALGMTPNNVNRQIVSTRNGLERSTRRHTLKIRSDIVLKSLEFIRHFESGLQQPKSGFSIFNSRIVSNNLSSRNPLIGCPTAYAYHPSDHIHFGLTEDLIKLWDIPLQSEEEANWFTGHRQPINPRLHETSRLTPEQYLFTAALATNGKSIDLADFADTRTEVIRLSESYLEENFIFIPDHRFSFDFPKYHTFHQACFEYLRRNSLQPPSRFRRYQVAKAHLVALGRLLKQSLQ
ncbi:MAG TPA: WavE lipopolysaccharide synthesis family protein [Rhodocyclaceae bacterium]